MDKKKQIKLWSHNTLAQNAMCFPQSLELIRYTIDEEREGLAQLLFEDDGKFSGKVLKTDEGVYCFGYFLEHRFAIHSKNNRLWKASINRLPSKFDLGVLLGLVAAANKQNTTMVTFRTRYALLKSLGLPTGDYYYHRVFKSLLRWSSTYMQFIGTYYDAERERRHKWPGRLNEFVILGGLSLPTEKILKQKDRKYDIVRIELTKSFLEQYQPGRYRAYFDPVVIQVLAKKSEAALNLYQYLRSFQMVLDKNKAITRDLKPFAERILSTIKPNYKYQLQFQNALEEINKAVTDGYYYFTTTKDSITFKYSPINHIA